MRHIKRAGALAFVAGLLLSTACGGKKGDSEEFPEDFNSKGDAYRVAWMMERAAPDSVARFVCHAALGHVKGTRIDTLANATLFAYENYRDSDAMIFGDEYERVVSEMNLEDKMRMYVLAGSEDAISLGYRLGLEYISHIRDKHLTVDDVNKELVAFRKACGNDSNTYRRFVVGFRTALDADHGKDVPEEIYNNFKNLD